VSLAAHVREEIVSTVRRFGATIPQQYGALGLGTVEAIRARLRCRGEEPGPLVGPVGSRSQVDLS